MDPNIKLKKAPTDYITSDIPYASLISSLLYISNYTYPDIIFAVNKLVHIL